MEFLKANGTLFSGIVSGVIVYVIARLKASGRINTSEANRLWDAQERFRTDITEQNKHFQNELNKLHAEHELLKIEHAVCQMHQVEMMQLITQHGLTFERRKP